MGLTEESSVCPSVPTSSLDKTDLGVSPAGSISVDADSVAKVLNLPSTCIEGIWLKAGELLQKENAIVPAPGQSPEARMVLSYSGKVPHMVTPTKRGGFSCDSSCPNWKSLGLCSHSIAVAEMHGKLSSFVSSLRKRRRTPSVTQLTVTTMPRGRGRKGSVPPRSRKTRAQKEQMPRVSFCVITTATTQTPVTTCGDSTNATVATEPGVMHTDVPVMPSPFQSPRFVNVPPPFFPSSYYTGPFTPTSVYPYAPPTPSHPFHPPSGPLYPFSFSTDSSNPFSLAFITGNISTCVGCKNKYAKSPQPPDDLCVKHQEWREFTPVGSTVPQSKYANVYYHCKPQCIWLRCPEFIPSQLDTKAVVDKLSPIHKAYLVDTFGLHVT